MHPRGGPPPLGFASLRGGFAALPRWLVLVLFAVVAISVAAAHWPALSAEAQCFDDGQYLTDNPLIQNPSGNSAWRFLTEVFEPSSSRRFRHWAWLGQRRPWPPTATPICR
jgi:hypothetical protein